MKISSDQIRKIVENKNDFKNYFNCDMFWAHEIGEYQSNDLNWDGYIEIVTHSSLANRNFFVIWGSEDYFDFAEKIEIKKLTKSQKDILIKMIEKIKDYKDPYEREFKAEKLGVFNNNSYNRNIPVYYNQEEDEMLVKINDECCLWKQSEWDHYKNQIKGIKKEYQELIDKCYEFANGIIDKPNALLINDSLFVKKEIIDERLSKNLRYNIGNHLGREAIPFVLMLLTFPSLILGGEIGHLFPILMKIAPILVILTPFILFLIFLLKYLPKWEDYANAGLVEYGLGYIEYEENQDILKKFGITEKKLMKYIEKTSKSQNKESYEEIVIPKEKSSKKEDSKYDKDQEYSNLIINNHDKKLEDMIIKLNEEIEKALNEDRIKSNDIILNKYKDELNDSIKCYNQLSDNDKNIVKENIEMLTEKVKSKGKSNAENISISVKTLNKILKE